MAAMLEALTVSALAVLTVAKMVDWTASEWVEKKVGKKVDDWVEQLVE